MYKASLFIVLLLVFQRTGIIHWCLLTVLMITTNLILHAKFSLYNFLLIASVFSEILDIDILVRSQKFRKTVRTTGLVTVYTTASLTFAKLYLQQVFSQPVVLCYLFPIQIFLFLQKNKEKIKQYICLASECVHLSAIRQNTSRWRLV